MEDVEDSKTDGDSKSKEEAKLQDWQLSKKKVLERNQYALENSMLSDCSFVVGKEPNTQIFNSHKMILAWASPVFQAMFYGGVAEKDGPISIPDVDPSAFKAMLQYIYTDSINLSSFDLGCDLLYAAKKYILPHVTDECKAYLVSNLNHENVCRVFEFAKLLSEPEIVQSCLKIMRENTDKVIKEPSFLDIQQSTLITILEQNFVMVSSELDLIDASLRWANHEAENNGLDTSDGTNLREILGQAFSLLRFLTLIPSEFASGPALSSLLTQDESFAILLNLNSPGCTPVPASICSSTEMRCCPTNDDFIWDAQRDSTNLCQRHTFIDNKSIIESAVTFTVNKNIRLLGIQVSSQVTNSGKIAEVDEDEKYSELIIVSLVGANKNLLAYIHFEEEVKFNSVVDIKFEHSVEVKHLEEHTLRVWFHRQGCYPRSTLDSEVQVGDVVFNFEKAETDVVRAISFTSSSVSDSKTFQCESPTEDIHDLSPRRFAFAYRELF